MALQIDAATFIIACIIGLILQVTKNIFFSEFTVYTILFLDITTILCSIYAFLHVNYKLLYFRKRSVIIMWKLYTIITFYSAIFYLRCQYNRYEFDTSKFTKVQGIIDSFLICFNGTLCVAAVSLHHGFLLSRIGRLIMTLFILSFVVVRTVLHYLNNEYDVEFSLLNGEKISIRSIIVARGFDFSVWFSYTCWNIITKSQILLLTSKIQLKWTKQTHDNSYFLL